MTVSSEWTLPADSLEIGAQNVESLAVFLGTHIELVVGSALMVIMVLLVIRQRLARYRSPRRFVSRSAQRQAHRNGAAIRARTQLINAPTLHECPWCADLAQPRGMGQAEGAAGSIAAPSVLSGASS